MAAVLRIRVEIDRIQPSKKTRIWVEIGTDIKRGHTVRKLQIAIFLGYIYYKFHKPGYIYNLHIKKSNDLFMNYVSIYIHIPH